MALAVALFSCVALSSGCSARVAGNTTDYELQLVPAETDILVWDQVDSPTSLSLNAVSMGTPGTRGWAVGASGIILAYTGGTWRHDAEASSLTDASLNALWLNPDASIGWAVGANGTILAYTDGTWRQHTQASRLTDASLNALWLNPDASIGWAVGASGTILAYTEGTWRQHPQASRLTDASLHALWFNRDGDEGWIAGDQAVFLRYQSDRWTLRRPFDPPRYVIAPLADSPIWWQAGGSYGWPPQRPNSSPEPSSFYDPVPYAPVYALWFTPDGTLGWAGNGAGQFLRYTPIRGWHKHLSFASSSDLGGPIRAIWLDAAETIGWAALHQDSGEIWLPPGLESFRVTIEALREQDGSSDTDPSSGMYEGDFPALDAWFASEGWPSLPPRPPNRDDSIVVRYHRDSPNTALFRYPLRWTSHLTSAHTSLSDLWIHADGHSGWAIGADGTILRLRSQTISDAEVTPASDDSSLSQLNGTFRVAFPRRVLTDSLELQIYPDDGERDAESDSAGLITTDYYTFSNHTSCSAAEPEWCDTVVLAFKTGLPRPPSSTYLIVLKATMDFLGPAVFQMEAQLRYQPTLGETAAAWFVDHRDQVFLWGGRGILIALPLLVLAVFLTRSRIIRAVVTHTASRGGRASPLRLLSRAIVFARPLKYRLLRRYATVAEDTLRFLSPSTYVPPVLTLHRPEVPSSEPRDMEADDGDQSERVLRSILADRNGVWFVRGPSGIGKTTLLEHWALRAAALGRIPFLLKLGGNRTALQELTVLIGEHGDIAWSSDRIQDLDMVREPVRGGEFVILIDGLNEDIKRSDTEEFVRTVRGNNIVVMSSQFDHGLTNVTVDAELSLGLFGKAQIEQLFGDRASEVLEADHLRAITELPHSATLLLNFLNSHGKLPESASALYEDLVPKTERAARKKVEQKAWEMFCSGERMFEPIESISEQEFWGPAVGSGLLTRAAEGRVVLRFRHERMLSYLVACYLQSEHDERLATLIDRSGRDVKEWDDVLEMWGEMLGEGAGSDVLRGSRYVQFMDEVKAMGLQVWEGRLYRQYERLVASRPANNEEGGDEDPGVPESGSE